MKVATAYEAVEGASAKESGAPGPVTSVSRALRILSAFDDEQPELGVTEVAQKLGFVKSTSFRLLQALEHEGFLRRVSGSKYALGWKIFELGARIQATGGLGTTIREELGRLVALTHETANFAILDRGEVLHLYKFESSRNLRLPSTVGRRAPAHSTGLGKALLASLPPMTVSEIIEERGLAGFTSHTITDRTALLQELERIRERGYAVDKEEFEEGLICIAAPIKNSASVSAAVSISGPASRLQNRIEDNAAIVQNCSTTLTERLGFALSWLSSASPGLDVNA